MKKAFLSISLAVFLGLLYLLAPAAVDTNPPKFAYINTPVIGSYVEVSGLAYDCAGNVKLVSVNGSPCNERIAPTTKFYKKILFTSNPTYIKIVAIDDSGNSKEVKMAVYK
jgi:hypothetical protein